jgi:hypothetical protein
MTYVLCDGDEEYVHYEHGDWPDVVLDDVPSVVLAADLVAALTPVVEGQARAPNDRDSHDMVDSRGGYTVEMRPHVVVDVVDGGEQAPQAVNLRVVAVDLRDDEDDGGHEHGKGKARDKRIGRHVEMLQRLSIVDVLDDLVREVVQLRQVGLHRLAEVGAFRQRLDQRQGHVESLARDYHGADGGDGQLSRRLCEGEKRGPRLTSAMTS